MKLPYRTEINARAVAKIWGKALDNPDWWRVEASTDDAEEILIYDYIGWPFNDPFEFANHIKALDGKDVTIRINSPGGDVFDGLAIYSAMKEYKGRITTRIEGLAASMASVIALGGDEVQAHKYTMYMIHEPLVLTVGNQHDLRDVADILQKLTVNFVDIYSDKAPGKKRDIKQKMQDETWFSAQEARDYGFVDTVLDLPAAKAGFDLSIFANAPPDGIAMSEGRVLNEREIERALRDAGASRSFAKAVVAKNYKPLREAEAKMAADRLVSILLSTGE